MVIRELPPTHVQESARSGDSSRAATVARHLVRLPCLVILEARIPILIVFALRVVVASQLSTRFSASSALLVVSWLALTISAYVYNGITDLDADRENGSRRPLASGRMSVSSARATAVVLAATGLAGCWYLAPCEGLLACASLILGWTYSGGPQLKRFPVACGVIVTAASALTYSAGACMTRTGVGTYVVYALWSAWVGFASPVKDLSDVHGDSLDGRRTLPVRLGLAAASRRMAVMIVAWSAILLTVARWVAPALEQATWVAALGSVTVAAYLMRVSAHQSRTQLRRPYRTLMFTQFAVNATILACLT